MDAVRQIIPTRLKARISHELSFPIGAEKLSSALFNVPQFMKLSLHFKGDRWREVRFRRFACIGVEHVSRRADLSDLFPDGNGVPLFSEWQVNVYPVPRALRHEIHQHIMNQALPEIRDWLNLRGNEDLLGEESLMFFFDEEMKTFLPESHSKFHPQRV